MISEIDSALIILNYNKYYLTQRIVENLTDINYKGHIVVVDNCSTNNSFEILKKSLDSQDKQIHVIKSNKNGGYAYGNNVGIKYILGEKQNIRYIGIINPDVVLPKDFSISKLINEIENRDDIAGITAMQIYNQEYNLSNIGWKLPGFREILISNLAFIDKILRISKYKNLEIDTKNSNIAKIEVMAGCFFLIKSSILQDVNFLDENTFLYYEENILSYKIIEKGYTFAVALNQYYIHDHEDKNNDAKDLTYRIIDYKRSLKSQLYYSYKYIGINKIQKLLLYFVSRYHLYIEIPIIHLIRQKIY